MIIQPATIPRKSEIKTCLVLIARIIANTGGTTDSQPNSIQNLN
jgi:hypothetical protein